MKYRKKPVIIEAFEFDGDLQDRDGDFYVPEWAIKAFDNGDLFFGAFEDSPPCELFISTLEGRLHVSVGDYIIQGIKGEIYPCKPDIFEATYEKVEESK